MLIDVDQFKTINDTHGHRAGDLALRQIAGSLQSSVGPRDLCGRSGGDEFLVILDDCDAAQAQTKAQQLQWAVAARRLELRLGRRIPLAISVGCAVFPDDATDVDQLMVAADSRMYDKKRSRMLFSQRSAGREAV